MAHLNSQFKSKVIEYGYYDCCPYCTLVIFPDKCYFSPNILSVDAPVRLPMVIFRAGSHGYQKLDAYFDYLWNKQQPVKIQIPGSEDDHS
jgi:hypothetical protein